MEVTRGWGTGRRGRYCLSGTELLFEMMEKILEIDSGDGCTTL